MAPVWFALRAGMRRRWRALVSLALLLGLAGGVVLTAAAGARRTDTAYPRLLTWAGASQVTTLLGGLDPAYFAAHDNLGALLLGRGKEEEADEHFREAARLAPGRAITHGRVPN